MASDDAVHVVKALPLYRLGTGPHTETGRLLRHSFEEIYSDCGILFDRCRALDYATYLPVKLKPPVHPGRGLFSTSLSWVSRHDEQHQDSTESGFAPARQASILNPVCANIVRAAG
jgi:hypothetical protein